MIDITIQSPQFGGEAPLEDPGVYGQLRGTMTEDSFVGHAASAILPQQVYDTSIRCRLGCSPPRSSWTCPGPTTSGACSTPY